MTMKDLVIFSGNSSPALTERICGYLDLPVGGAKVKTFSDGEIQIEIHENVRLRDIFIVQSTCSPVNDNLVELLLMLDALKRSSAKRASSLGWEAIMSKARASAAPLRSASVMRL